MEKDIPLAISDILGSSDWRNDVVADTIPILSRERSYPVKHIQYNLPASLVYYGLADEFSQDISRETLPAKIGVRNAISLLLRISL